MYVHQKGVSGICFENVKCFRTVSECHVPLLMCNNSDGSSHFCFLAWGRKSRDPRL